MGELYKPDSVQPTKPLNPARGSAFRAWITTACVTVWLAAWCSSGVAVAANQPPTIGSMANQVVQVDQSTHALRLALSDAETPTLDLIMSATSSDTNVVPVENVFFGIFAPNQYVTVTPAFGKTGFSTITLTVSDGVNTASTSFLFTVNPPPENTLRFVNPTAMIIPPGGPASLYPSVINVSGMSGIVTNVALVLSGLTHEYVTDLHMLLVGPAGQKVVVFGSVAQGRAVHNLTVTLVDSSDYPLPQSFSLWPEPLRPTDWAVTNYFPAPAPGGPYAPVAMSSFNGAPANGLWSLYVYDDFAPDQGNISGGWSLSISTTGTNKAPVIDIISNQTTVVKSALPILPFTVTDSSTPAGELVVSAASSNPALVPDNGIVLGGSGSNRTVTITPTENQIGSATITLMVSDGELTATSSFDVTVQPGVLVLNVDNQARAYGTANPEFTGTMSGLLPGDTIAASFTTTAATGSHVGDYAIIPVLDDPQGRLGNYIITTNPGVLTVTTAPLIITANDRSRLYGAANPELIGMISGIQNNDNITASYSTLAETNSPVGAYAIVPIVSGPVGNYSVTLNNGTLSIVPAEASLTLVSSQNPSFAGTSVVFTASLAVTTPSIVAPAGSIQFFANDAPLGGAVSVNGGMATITTDALPTGTNVVRAVYAADGNCHGSSNSVVQVVNIQAQRPSIAGITKGQDGMVTVNCIGTPGAIYLLQGIANFGASGGWMNLSTNLAGAGGQWSYTESMSGTSCYYRIAIP